MKKAGLKHGAWWKHLKPILFKKNCVLTLGDVCWNKLRTVLGPKASNKPGPVGCGLMGQPNAATKKARMVCQIETAMTVWFPKKLGGWHTRIPNLLDHFLKSWPGIASWCSSRFVSPKASRKMENLQLTTGLSKHWMIYFQVMVGKWGLKSKPWDFGGPIFRQTQANPSNTVAWGTSPPTLLRTW